jgi:hypothetical protein
MLSIFIPWHKTPLIPLLKTTIKVIYSPGIKVFYAGVVFGSLWYLIFKNKFLICVQKVMGHIDSKHPGHRPMSKKFHIDSFRISVIHIAPLRSTELGF